MLEAPLLRQIDELHQAIDMEKDKGHEPIRNISES